MARLLLVSNRLPVTVKTEGSSVVVSRSSGGLATGLSGPHDSSKGLWIGWPGDISGLDEAQRRSVDERLAEMRIVPVPLAAQEISRFYEGFSNRVLWPLFHYMLEHVPEHSRDWECYRDVNQRFADLVVEHYRPGDTVWVHDYQLLLVPGMLRKRIPEARIGFFLHIPFPSSEIFRTLPWRSELLEGMLGADLIGFHTLSYSRHFGNTLLQMLGLTPDADGVDFRGRRVRIGAFPMGIDAQNFARQATTPETQAELQALRQSAQGEKLLVGVDRLDYTKGIRRRLLAVGRLLEREPSLRGKLRFIQVAVPSRTEVLDYEQHRRDVDELVGRINGAYGTASWTPVHYLFRSIPFAHLSALYCAADVMLVTPLRDGMNLVAKEFLASRVDGDGVLLLSELAGATSELGEAVRINPYDVDGMAQQLKVALEMPEEERRLRLSTLRQRVMTHDVHRWVKQFLGALEEAPLGTQGPHVHAASSRESLSGLAAKIRQAPRWCFALDYDGTLREFASLPELARPDAELRALLAALARRPGAKIHVVSGRPADFLERYLGDLPIGLHAEHGLLSRSGPGQSWRPAREVPVEWKPAVREILELFVERTPGTFVEEKTASLAWHYRNAEPHFAFLQARELQLHLTQTFSNAPISLLSGDKVLEIRASGVHKGLVVPRLTAEAGPGAVLLAMGDDRTDEDLFEAMPPGSVLLHVGPKPSRADYRLNDVASARHFLHDLLA